VTAFALAARLTGAWVRLYTRGLPADVRAARQAELESDLWEHEQWRRGEVRRGRVAYEIVARLIGGMGADLSWRTAYRKARRQSIDPFGGGAMTELLKKHGMTALAIALGVWATTVVPILIGSDDRLQAAVSVAFGLLILGGLVAVHRGLRGGRVAVAVGAVGTGLIAVWLVLPAMAAVAIVIWLYATRDGRQAPPLPA
jgi:VIT1/CCC1 family predicted Fe2+/Mn2+ transporter